MTINSELKQVIKDFSDEYAKKAEESRQEYIKHLPAGQAIPPKGIIFGDNNKDTFNQSCVEKRQKVRAIIDKEIRPLKLKLTEAPSTDAVNSIQLLKMRNSVSEKEISDLLDRYGDNDQVRAALVDIGKDHGYHSFSRSSNEERIENLEDLKRSLENSLTLKRMEDRGSAFYSWLNSVIDNIFPE